MCYFSGTATYQKEIEVPAKRLQSGRELWLGLGTVKNENIFQQVRTDTGDFFRRLCSYATPAAAIPGITLIMALAVALGPLAKATPSIPGIRTP